MYIVTEYLFNLLCTRIRNRMIETIVCIFIVGQRRRGERENEEKKREDETAICGHLYICLVDKEKVS